MTTPADPIHDQTIAAFEEAAELIKTVPVQRTPIINRVMFRWSGNGEWTSCGHLPSPRLCFGLAHLPGHLMCTDCWLSAAEHSENSCDWCGASPQVDDRVALHPTVYPIGPAVVIFVFCDRHIADMRSIAARTQP